MILQDKKRASSSGAEADLKRDRRLRLRCPAVFLLSIVVLFFSAARAQAAGKFIPFEKRYTREGGEAVFVESRFSVADPRAPYTLQVSNEGSSGPADKASGWEIQINGVSVIKPPDFNPRAALFEKAVTLQSENAVKVKLKGKAGGKLTVRIVGVDTLPPELAILSPADALLTNQSKVAFQVRYGDATAGIAKESFRATLNGKEITSLVQVGEREAAYTAESLPDGAYTFSVSVADGAENRSEARVAFQIDTLPPESRLAPSAVPNESGWSREIRLEVSDRPGGSGVTEVRYQLEDDPEEVVPIDPASPGPLSIPLPLPKEGKRTFHYYAVDRAGNREAPHRQTLQIDQTPPQLKATLSPPPNEFGWHRTNVTVSFEGIDPLSGLASLTPPVTLTGEGENQLAQGVAVDRAGNERRSVVSVWIDKSPPTLTLDAVPEGAALSSKVLPITLLFEDTLSQVRPDRLKVLLNRVDLSPVFTLVSGQATKTFTLADRKYTLVASIEDRAGNKTELTRHFTVDSTPPDLLLTAPAGGQLVKEQAIRVAGRVTDAGTSVRALRVNGTDFPFSADGEFAIVFPLAIEGANPLKIEAVDEAGNVASKEIMVVRATRGPQISAVTPAPGTFTKGSTVTVSGKIQTVTAPAASFMINGNPVPLTAGPTGEIFSAEVPLPREGKNRIEIVATDTVGHQTAYPPFEVIRDTTPPAIEILQPAANASVATSPVVVAGRVQDAAAIDSLLINGRAVPVQENRFSAEIPLEVGENALSLSATDPAGNNATLQQRVLLDNVPPQLVVTAPADDRPVNTSAVRLAGRVVDPISGTASVRINGKRVSLTPDGEFAETFPLPAEGENRFEWVAVDPAGNTTRMSRGVVRDTRPPTLQILQPAAGRYTNEPTLSIKGTAADPGGALASVAINGAPIALGEAEEGGMRSFKTVVLLTEGENLLQVTATDLAGNSRSTPWPVILDTRSPAITIERPAAGALVPSSPVILAGHLSDLSPITSLTMNGAPVPIQHGAFRYPVVLAPGINLLTFSAVDAAGNSRTLRWETRLDDRPPQITLSLPADQMVTREKKIRVAGEITDDGLLAGALLNGRPLSLKGSAFSTELALIEGENRFVFSAKDAAGNKAERAVTIVRDNIPPAIRVTAPEERATLHARTVTVRGTINDPTAKVEVNGILAEVTGEGFVAKEVPLRAGENELTIVAVDPAGNERRLTWVVVVEDPPSPPPAEEKPTTSPILPLP